MKAKLSMAFEDLRGKDGNVVIRKGRSGLTLTPRRTPSNPKTVAQRSVRANLSKAARTFKSMTVSQAAAWEAAAAGIVRSNPISGDSYQMTGINLFVEYTTKFLQATPGGTIPMAPPTTPFAGDTITLSATSGEPGKLTFTASAANAAGVTTEILIQRLASPHRNPQPGAYRHASFKAFASGSLTEALTLPAGYYATGYRFVNLATGQATEMIALPLSTVTLSVEVGGESSGQKKKAA